MENPFYQEARKVWHQITKESSSPDFDVMRVAEKRLSQSFNVGPFYFYLFDVRNGRFRYISSAITRVLGFDPNAVTVDFFMSRIHPEDRPIFLNNETQVVQFFRNLPIDKISKYKVSYDYRVIDAAGRHKRILQQVVTIDHDAAGNVLMTLGVHTDISFMGKADRSTLSFIGLDDEPSYNDVKVAPVYQKPVERFTKREKEIMECLLNGDKTADIAKKLNISKYTVDTHRRNILAKTNAKTTHELAVKIMSGNLL